MSSAECRICGRPYVDHTEWQMERCADKASDPADRGYREPPDYPG